jgi:putative Mg2+ transporter-C (MgtC) family protein
MGAAGHTLCDVQGWRWLGDVRGVLSPPWSEILLIAVSFVCGGLVGAERERQDKPAGLRTLVLICVGSTVFTVASLLPSLAGHEPARIAAQIVTGVGFLGAGSILRDRHGITGLTTAATVWATAAVGIVVGAGYAIGGLALSATILLTLVFVRRIETLLGGGCEPWRVLVVYRPEGGRTLARLLATIDEGRGPRVEVEAARPAHDGREALPIAVCAKHREHRALLAALAELHQVDELRYEHPAQKSPS